MALHGSQSQTEALASQRCGPGLEGLLGGMEGLLGSLECQSSVLGSQPMNLLEG